MSEPAGADRGEKASQTPAERRRYERVECRLEAVIHATDASGKDVAFSGHLRNLSAGGMCFMLPRDPRRRMGQIVHGRIRIDKTDGGDATEMGFGIQWKREEPDGSLLFGVCFDAVYPEITSKIGNYLRIQVWL
ncbi:MAG TPA: PilZ domain-containing protein [Armatimonadota bacterium]|nr:PilZ domain-containing protein [Armatimonadota bacterium]